ncbi:hypothetical protein [Lewinella sp. W8]|uniref:hypothetical protein n=1 Tax=Lewinella sp. W8 TaxID=2528208 RepID=UPI0010682728|nr:hypothetical protein [Lewinella sp. W8]MTB53055.1 hypothetical protein [Lewinella sp. W8]
MTKRETIIALKSYGEGFGNGIGVAAAALSKLKTWVNPEASPPEKGDLVIIYMDYECVNQRFAVATYGPLEDFRTLPDGKHYAVSEVDLYMRIPDLPGKEEEE